MLQVARKWPLNAPLRLQVVRGTKLHTKGGCQGDADRPLHFRPLRLIPRPRRKVQAAEHDLDQDGKESNGRRGGGRGRGGGGGGRKRRRTAARADVPPVVGEEMDRQQGEEENEDAKVDDKDKGEQYMLVDKTPKKKQRGSLLVSSSTKKQRKNRQRQTATKKRQASARWHRFVKSVEETEGLAKAAIDVDDISLASVLNILRKLEVPRNTTRKNVMPTGNKYINGMLLGLFAYGGRVGLTVATLRHPYLTKLLIKLIRKEVGDFPFTSIQLNYNYASKPHVDRNNLGPSYIVSFGDHSGGRLWVHRPGGETNFFYPPGSDVISSEYRPGNNFPGEDLCVQNAWTKFDGTKLHFTRPFQGERYSLIFFSCDRCCSAESNLKRKFAEAGFDFDWEEPRLQEMVQEKFQRRQEVSEQLALVKAEERKEERRKHMESRGRCMGRTWGGGWGLRCTASAAEGSDFCNSHKARDRWQTHGRVDGPVPPAKKEEMTKMQQRLLKQGKMPPSGEDEFVTILVDLPESLSTSSSSSVLATSAAPSPASPPVTAAVAASTPARAPAVVPAVVPAPAGVVAAVAVCAAPEPTTLSHEAEEAELATAALPEPHEPSGAAGPANAAASASPAETSAQQSQPTAAGLLHFVDVGVGDEMLAAEGELMDAEETSRRQEDEETQEVPVKDEVRGRPTAELESKLELEEGDRCEEKRDTDGLTKTTPEAKSGLLSWGLGLRAWLLGSRRSGGL